MGGFPRRQFVFALFDRLANDGNENVKYGAMRSLVEIASFDAKFTTLIVDETIKRIGLVSKSKAVVGELSRATFLTEHFQLDLARDTLVVDHVSHVCQGPVRRGAGLGNPVVADRFAQRGKLRPDTVMVHARRLGTMACNVSIRSGAAGSTYPLPLKKARKNK
jgi:hypothetical protein